MNDKNFFYVLQQLKEENNIPLILEVFDHEPTHLELYVHIMTEPNNSGLKAISELLENSKEVLDTHDEPIPVNVDNVYYYLSKHQADTNKSLVDKLDNKE